MLPLLLLLLVGVVATTNAQTSQADLCECLISPVTLKIPNLNQTYGGNVNALNGQATWVFVDDVENDAFVQHNVSVKICPTNTGSNLLPSYIDKLRIRVSVNQTIVFQQTVSFTQKAYSSTTYCFTGFASFIDAGGSANMPRITVASPPVFYILDDRSATYAIMGINAQEQLVQSTAPVTPVVPAVGTTTDAPTTSAPTTNGTTNNTTQAPTTQSPTTVAPTTTQPPTTQAPTTQAPTTMAPSTQAPTTTTPTTLTPTTLAPTTVAPTTLAPTTTAPTTLIPTTLTPTTPTPTTQAPTTVAPTTVAPTTPAPTTVAPTTVAPTTAGPTTPAPTTVAPTTLAPTTVAPTTVAPTTPAPTTTAPTTVAPTTVAPTTTAPTTAAPTTTAPTTAAPTSAPLIAPSWRLNFTATVGSPTNDGSASITTAFTAGSSAATSIDSAIPNEYIFSRAATANTASTGYYVVSYPFNATAWSKSVWIKISRASTVAQNLISSVNGYNAGTHAFFAPNDDGVFIERGPGGSNLVYTGETAVPSTGVWTHLGVTFSSGTYTMYKNGVPNGASASGSAYAADTSGFDVAILATSPPCCGLDGSIWKPSYYEVGLTAAQMKATYNAQCALITGCVQAP